MFLTLLESIITIVSIVVGFLSLRNKEEIKRRIFPTLTKKQAYRTIILLALLLWSIAVMMLVLLYSNSKGSFDQTVFVHGPESRQQNLISIQGYVTVDLDSDRRKFLIGENGKTVFSEIPKKFKRTYVEVSVDVPGYYLKDPDTTYKIEGKPIYIALVKDSSLGIISGIVISNEDKHGIGKAQVLIGTDTAIYTNELGIFKTVLPFRMQVKNSADSYSLRIYKDGYKSKSEYYYPQSGHIEIRLEPLH